VADSQNHRIQKFSFNGTFLDTWGIYGIDQGDMILPNCVAAAENGYIYDTTYGAGTARIQCFNPQTGGLIFDKAMSDTSFSPTFMCADGNGSIYVGGEISSPTSWVIQKYDLNGNYLGLQWGNTGTGNSIITTIYGMCADHSGNVLVDDMDLIKTFNGSTGLLNSVLPIPGSMGGGWSLCMDNSGLVDVTRQTAVILQLNPISGSAIQNFGNGSGSNLGQIETASFGSVFNTINGWLYITDEGNNRVDVYAPCGTPHLPGW